MPSKIMIGQLPLIIEEEENVEEFASSSRRSTRQASLKDGADVTTNASKNEIPKGELDPKSADEKQDNSPSYGTNENGRKKKRYHRHTQHQIQELEAFFMVCPHPDENQRKQLSRDLGLEPLQVKFWFQNKRTQMKAYHEHADNERLKVENEKLRAENIKYREALTKACCCTCGGVQALGNKSIDEYQLRVENVRLRKEVEHITSLAAKFDGRTYANFSLESPSFVLNPHEFELGAFGGQPNNVGEISGEDDSLRSLTGPTDFDKIMVIEIAVSAMEQFIRMSKMELPLWLQTMDHRKYVLNEDAYYNMFPTTSWLNSAGFKIEASRDTNIVMMNHTSLIEVFMDVDKWLAMFASMVSRALILEVISVGIEPGHYNGALQVMSAEFQVLTPCVPTRECIFIRYCKQLAEDTWAVVDVSCDNLFSSIPPAKCQRKPSGCIIQEMPNGLSKVTWIEHVEGEDQGTHYLGKSIIESGLAFGAQRWIAILSRQCERLRSTMANNFSLDDINDTVLTNPETRKNILKLSERMVLNFCGGVTSSTAYSWTNLYGSGNEETRIMTKKHENEVDNSSGTLLNATTWFWLPVTQKVVFEFLRDESSRSEWDVLFNGGGIRELIHITNGKETGNCVSLIRGSNLSQSDVLILQECSFDPTSSSIIYAPVDKVSIKQLLDGGNPDYIPILPSGFTIFPCNAPAIVQDRAIGGTGEAGSLVTVAFQILIDSVPTAKLPSASVSVINGLVEATKQKIKAILAPNHA